MKKILYCLSICFWISPKLFSQIDAGLFRYPDVSKTQIVFTYANDLWIMPKDGGTAIRLSSPPGVEIFPKFSPDGKSIAFSGDYDGNIDVYTMPVTGGIPVRLTSHGNGDRTVDWTNDGKRVLFASNRESGKARFNQFYTVAANGGPDDKLPLAYAEYGSYSPDGKEIAVVFRTQVGRNWKRYRGGWKADIKLFNLSTYASTSIGAETDAGNEFPMWSGNSIYFLSDRGQELRMNLWKYDLTNKTYTQLTHFKEYDVHYPSLGPEDIVFEAGGKLYLYSLSTGKQKSINVDITTDKAMLKPKLVSVAKDIQDVSISPDGNRVLVQARGDIFSVPAENGFIKDITQTSGVAERYPGWSPDGKYIAYWSDQSGEYELWIKESGEGIPAKKLSAYGAGYRYRPFWSPDSKKLAFIDKAMQIKIYNVSTNQTSEVDHALRYTHGTLEGYRMSWSPDSRWLAYHRDLENQHNAVYIYDYTNKKSNAITDGFYECSSPVFDPDGKYLFLLTSQSFTPLYSSLDNTFIYANSTQIAAIPLQKDSAAIMSPKNDTVAIKTSEPSKDEKATGQKDAVAKKSGTQPVHIDFEGIERRMEILPLKAGNYADLACTKGKIIYRRLPNTGAGDGKSTLKFFDLVKKEEKTILDDVDFSSLSFDGKKILVSRSGSYAVIAPQEGQKFDKPLKVSDMQMMVDPAKEWRQIFMDVWRFERDYFYDANMHGVNWNLAKERYLKMLDGAATREEVDFVIGELIGELNASHTYHGGGDMEIPERKSVGYLGVDWQADGNFYKIKTIIRGAPWDAEAHSSLDVPGVNIKEGDYILAVNGAPLTTAEEPFAAFTGLANKTVELTYNSTASWAGAKTAVVKTMSNEYRLRNLAWIERMRKKVNEATQGEVGYIYVPSTGIEGQDELMRMFNAQWDKKALIIDERFNDGGQIPDRFIEMLNRDPLAYWAIRDGSDWPWPPFANFGPKVMLINGWSGSGGDAFPDYFRKKKLGPLIGARTWGGLIGISGVPTLIDGGGVTVPTFRMYNPDGSWFMEGHGVDPDIAVPEDLSAMAKGIDPQLERAITEIKNEIKTKGYQKPQRPAPQKRSN